MTRLWTLILPLVAGGCFFGVTPDCMDGGCFEETGFAQFVCLESPTKLVDFGEVVLGTTGQSRTVSFINHCSDPLPIHWTLDDPAGVFSYAITQKTDVHLRFSPQSVGTWEAQFIGVHSGDDTRVAIQIFATSIDENGSDE